MEMKPTYILCDQIQTGKTSALNDSLQYLRPCMGFICPDINGTRMLVELQNMKIHDFQIRKPIFSGDLKMGKFAFLGSTFKLAQNMLKQIPHEFDGHVIIDEIGKLELQDSGLEPALGQFLKREQVAYTQILVVRDYLLDQVKEKYNLHNSIILDPFEFKRHFKSEKSKLV